MYIEFLKTELKYDSNYNMLDKYGSFEKDIEKEDKFGFVCVEDKEILGYYIWLYRKKQINERDCNSSNIFIRKKTNEKTGNSQ